MGFRKDFVWGSATASYQVEGATYEDGKGLTIWDVFCREPGKIYQGQTGEVSCDQYHRYKQDVADMKEMGQQAYRFSLSWARIQPDGEGEVNEAGLAYYDALVDELLRQGIEPYVTLYHWDLPYALHQKGGPLNPDMPQMFARYAASFSGTSPARVKHFMTLNEPQCIAGLGYYTGDHAPGLKVGRRDLFTIWRNLLLADGLAVKALRENAPEPIQVGAAPCGALYYPASHRPEDIEAARTAMFTLPSDDVNDFIWNIASWSDPVFFGRFPQEAVDRFGEDLPQLSKEEAAIIAQPLDFYGQNMYNAVEVRAGKDGKPERVERYDGFPKTAIQWPVTPECMYWAPKFRIPPV